MRDKSSSRRRRNTERVFQLRGGANWCDGFLEKVLKLYYRVSVNEEMGALLQLLADGRATAGSWCVDGVPITGAGTSATEKHAQVSAVARRVVDVFGLEVGCMMSFTYSTDTSARRRVRSLVRRSGA